MGAFSIAAWAFSGLAASLLGSALLIAHTDGTREIALGDALRAHVRADLAREHALTLASCARTLRTLTRVDNPSRVALTQAFEESGDADESLFRGGDGAPDALVVRGSASAARVTTELLERGLNTPTLFGPEANTLLTACRFSLGDATLWLVRTAELRALSQRWTDAAHDMGLVLEVDTDEGRAVLSLSDVSEQHTHTYRVQAVRSGLWPMLLRALGAALLVALLCAELARRKARGQRALEDDVLGTLETLATRIGQGDLSATITRNVGGRAEQTFRTFDRMTKELRDARAQLREAERADAFRDVARNLAHELKNPLFPIRTSIETLQKTRTRMPEAFDEAFEETTRVVLEEVQRLERIVREFAEFARLPAPIMGRIDLASLAEDVAALHGRERITTQNDAHAAVFVRADRELIMQVLVNLVLNAQQAIAADGRVELRIARSADGAQVHVDDDGPGVPSDARVRIFEPYFSTKSEGTGLGLAIARRIAHEHGGRLDVLSGPLGGARFTLTLPDDEPGMASRT